MQLLKIRYYQIKNDLSFLFLVIVAIVAALSYFFFNKTDNQRFYFLALIVFILIQFHNSRKDLSYVLKHLDNPKKQLITEYQLFLLPFSIPSLFTQVWYFFFIIQLAGLIIAYTNIKSTGIVWLPTISKYINPIQFEWISGLRKNWLSFLLFMVISIILSSVKLFPLAALCIINMGIMGFYTEAESRQMLTANSNSPNKIMGQKILFSIKIMGLINLPILIINSIFNTDFAFINLIFLLYNCLLMAFAVVCKYNAYRPKTTLTSISLQFALAIAAVVFPYLIPLVILLTIYYYNQAIKNLSFYIHDNT